ncbi:MAG: hypothetical protein J6D46_00805 [Lachnospiraceae bacterium]|nr:hypothetical protein [Lachnospiraceae bacterium]
MDRSLYLTENELFVLLRLGGRQKVTCFPVSSPDGAEVRQTLLALFRKGIVKNEGERFAPDGSWGEVFRQLYASPRLYWLTNEDASVPEVLVYAGAGKGKNFIILENISARSMGRYRVSMLPEEEINAFLTDNGTFPEIHLMEEDRYEVEHSRFLSDPSGNVRIILTIREFKNGETEERRKITLERRGAIISCTFRENGMIRVEAAVKDTAARIIC